MDLTFDSFVIKEDAGSSGVGRNFFYGKRLMGTYKEIQDRSRDCQLCGLIMKSGAHEPPSLCRTKQTKVADDAECRLFWRVDGREHVPSADGRGHSTAKRTRRLAIEWQDGGQKLDLSYIVLVAPDGEFFADGTANPQSRRTGRSTFFLGRKLTSLDKTNIQLVKDWLNICREGHQECEVNHDNAKYQELFASPFFLVVDLEQKCLEPLTEASAQYVALSYTWGSPTASETDEDALNEPPPFVNGSIDEDAEYSPTFINGPTDDYHDADDAENSGPRTSTDPPQGRFKTTSQNVEDLLVPGGIGRVLQRLPKAVQNAIALTRLLGLRYIWVDTLCIVQDSPESWRLNARSMDVIYGNAELTICAADGNGADHGLEALFQPSGGAAHRSYRPASDQQIIIQYPGKDEVILELLLSWPSETYVACSRWNQRAWTFQERMISPRCLICVNQRVYFQCRTTTMSEDIFSDKKTAKGTAGWSVELHGAPAHTLKRLEADPVSVYKDCLRMYTRRDLTYEKDILEAFAGIGNVVCQSLGRPKSTDEQERALLFGLPASHFDYALLWQPQEVPERRKLREAVFPSWSWSGWRCKKGMSYREAAVAGPEINLHDWLLNHTWITYYIRDGNGYLRLVWDPKQFEQNNQSVEERWKGYNTAGGDWPSGSNLSFEVDFHGRPFNEDLPRQGRVHEKGGGPGRKQFYELLHPFRARNTMLIPGAKMAKQPDRPYLQFWTWWGRFYVDVEAENDSLIDIPAVVGDGLKRYAILDRHGDFAGTIMLEDAWSRTHPRTEPQEFIALSDARTFDKSESGDWNLYTEEDLDLVPWQLYNVLLVTRDDPNKEEQKQGHNVVYRRGLGKVFKKAFEHACCDNSDEVSKQPLWKEVILG